MLLYVAYCVASWRLALYGTGVNAASWLLLYGLYMGINYPIAKAAIAASIKRSPERDWGPWIFDAPLKGFALWREMFRAFWKLPLTHRIGYILLLIGALALGILLAKV
jgi:hypothetical protein